MSLWNTPADPDLNLFPGLTEDQIIEALSKIDIEDIKKRLEDDPEFQRRLRTFRPRPMSAEDWLESIY